MNGGSFHSQLPQQVHVADQMISREVLNSHSISLLLSIELPQKGETFVVNYKDKLFLARKPFQLECVTETTDGQQGSDKADQWKVAWMGKKEWRGKMNRFVDE